MSVHLYIYIYIYLCIYNAMLLSSSLSLSLCGRKKGYSFAHICIKALELMYRMNVGIDFVIS